jgi:GR25 family glycosyltransferase involved in LPS biosynthesis
MTSNFKFESVTEVLNFREVFLSYLRSSYESGGVDSLLSEVKSTLELGLSIDYCMWSIRNVLERDVQFDVQAAISSYNYLLEFYPGHPGVEINLALVEYGIGDISLGISRIKSLLDKIRERDVVVYIDVLSQFCLWDEVLSSSLYLEKKFELSNLDLESKKVRAGSSFLEMNPSEVDLCCISLDREVVRRKIVAHSFSGLNVPVRFKSGILGSSLPSGVKDFLVSNISSEKSNRLQPGAFGCALSHVAAWEDFLNSSQKKFGFFIESDSVPYRNISLSDSSANSFMGNNDVLFVNHRMSTFMEGVVNLDGSNSVTDRLCNYVKPAVWGADGYILSRSGAEMLLKAFSIDKILGHIDGQITSYAFNNSDSIILKETFSSKLASDFRSSMISGLTLKGGCLNNPIVISHDYGFSSIR